MRYILNFKFILLFFILLINFSTTQAFQTIEYPDTINNVVNDISVKSIETGRFFKIKQEYSTSAISHVKGENLQSTNTRNVANTLVGKLSGLNVTQSSGEPVGIADNSIMSIRGKGTYGITGNNTYKIFVDGFESDLIYLNDIPVAAIESISILKDAAALATFGMNGAEGVIWVTTKRGDIEKPVFRFHITSGLQQPLHIAKPLNSFEYASLYNQAISNDNDNVWTPYYSANQLEAYKNGTGIDVDWYDEVLKSHSLYTNGVLSFSGGNEITKYNVILDYLNQPGLIDVPNTDVTSNELLKRYSVRANLDMNFFQIFEAKVDLGGNISGYKRPNYSIAALWENMARYPSNIYNVYDDENETQWSGTTHHRTSPVAAINALGWISQNFRNLQANFGLKEKLDFITPGLFLYEALSFRSFSSSETSKYASYERYYQGERTTIDKDTPIRASSLKPMGQIDWKQFQATLGYQRAFHENNINAALNYHQSNYMGDSFETYDIRYQNISGRANYNYGNKYIGEFGFSYFGSDAFSPNNRWHFYPAVSAAWVISNESLFKENHIVTLLKLRASTGKSGAIDNNSINSGRFLYQQYYQSAENSFYQGNTSPVSTNTLTQRYMANTGIAPEQSVKHNIGFDVNLQQKIAFTIDVFVDKRTHILIKDNSIPRFYGDIISYKNIGEVTNKGLEFTGHYNDNIGSFEYAIYGMASYYKNVIDYMAETPPAYAYNSYTGRPIGARVGLVSLGYYQTEDFNIDGSLKEELPLPSFGPVQPGDLKYKDLNNDGVIDQTDVTAIGNPDYPTLAYSFGADFRYKGVDVSLFFIGENGSDVNILSSARIQTEAFVDNGNVFPIARGAWAYYPEQGIDTRAIATYPRLTTIANNNNYRSSSFWIKKSDFIRLHNVELGYTFSSKLIENLNLSGLRVFVNSINPLTWSSLLKDYQLDPERLGRYPINKSYNIGLSITF